MKVRVFTTVMVFLLIFSFVGAISTTSENQNLINNQVDISSTDTLDMELDSIDAKLLGGLDTYMEDGLIPDNFTGRIMVFSKSNQLPFETLLPAVKLGVNYLHFVEDTTPDKIRSLYLDNQVKIALPDTKIDYDALINPPGDEQINTDSFQAKDILKTQQVMDEYGYTGDGVKVGVVDSGIDFGITDLVDSAALNPEGFLASFDATGTGLAITGLTTQSTLSQGRTVLPIEDQVLDIFVGEQYSISPSNSFGINLENLDITGISKPSVSNNYKVGIARQGSYVESLPTQYFLFILTDSVTAGVYDTLYVDMETSLAITLEQAGLIFTTGDTFFELNEFDLTNDEPFGANNPIPAKDITGDGINDVSMGGLGTVIDFVGVTSDAIVNGIDPSGNAIGMFFDPVGHGTLVASTIGSNGTTLFPVFDDKTTEEVENSTLYNLMGMAPDVKIVGHKALTLSEFILGWLWTGGLELVEGTEGLVWQEEPANLVDLSSNSWGNGIVAPDNYLKGFDPYSILLDYLSTADTLYDGYPGVVFVVSAGNGAPGFGSSATPAMASMAITVGASTYYHYRDGATGRNDVAWFSGRGPSGYGIIKPDIITPGHTGFVNHQVIQGYGNGTYASGTFGGTSEAAPRATGVLALMVQAFRAQGVTPTFENLRLTLKATATDLGFDPTQQGAGLANAYRAVTAIVDSEVIISSTYSSQLAGQHLQKAFFKSYEVNHPFVDNPAADIVTAITPEQIQNGLTLQIQYSNGTLVDPSDYDTGITRSQLSFEDYLQIKSNNIQNEISIAELFPSDLSQYDYMEIGLTMNKSTWDAFLSNGLNTPNLTLFDSASNDIIADQFSANTWSQLLFAGFPDNDFDGEPILRFTDPGYANAISGWDGMQYTLHARFFTDTPYSDINITENSGNIELNKTSIPNELQIWNLNVDVKSEKYLVPIMISPDHQAEYAENVTSIGSDLDTDQPYNQYHVANTFDWGYRSESGDFNHYRIDVPAGATYLAAFMHWQDQGLAPNAYLFNSTGQLVTKTDTEYLGGGFYLTETSEPNAQNLLVEAEDETYYLMIHTTQLPYTPGPFELEVFFRYLTIEQLPIPEPTYSKPISTPITGAFGIDVSNYSINEFPEFKIQSMSAQVYQGRNGSFSESVTVFDLTPGINENFAVDEFEGVHSLNLTQGEKVELYLDLETGDDVDMYVFKEGDVLKRDNDLLGGLGTTPRAGDEHATFAADTDGNYTIYLDYVGSEEDMSGFSYELSYESRKGPTFFSQGKNLVFNTEIFPDDSFGVKMTFSSNFGVDFVRHIQISTENSEPFTFSIDSPSNGDTISGDVSVSWSSSRVVIADVYVLVDNSWMLVGLDISASSYSFDSTIIPNGESKIKVEATDKIYTITDVIDVTFSNSEVSTIPDIQSSQVNDLPFLNLIFVNVITIIIIRHKRR